jgi:hypothetical protein
MPLLSLRRTSGAGVTPCDGSWSHSRTHAAARREALWAGRAGNTLRTLSLTHQPSATSHSPAVTEGNDPETVVSSRCPFVFTRRTQKPCGSVQDIQTHLRHRTTDVTGYHRLCTRHDQHRLCRPAEHEEEMTHFWSIKAGDFGSGLF